MSKTLVEQIRNLGIDCPTAFDHAVPIEDVGPEGQPESIEVLPARAGDSEVVAVPPETEEVRVNIENG